MKTNRFRGLLIAPASVGLILILLGVWVSGARGQTVQENTVEAVHAGIARRVIEEVWNGEDPDRVAELYAPTFRWHSGAGPDAVSYRPETWLSGPDSQLQAIRRSFPDLEITIEKIVVTGDMAVVCYSARGTFTVALDVEHLGRSSAMEPSGQAEAWDGVFMYRFEDGKIADEWWYWDTEFEAIMQQ